MRLKKFFEKWKNKYIRSPVEDVFLVNIYYELLGEDGLDYIEPAFKEQDINGNDIILDYKVQTPYRKYDLEINGRTYHDFYSVGTIRFNELTNRKSIIQDELGYKILDFTANDIKNNPERAINQLRRGIRADEYLNRFFKEKKLNRAQMECFNQILQRYCKLGYKQVILSLPMGMGKTFVSAKVGMKLYEKYKSQNFKILYLAHKNLILEQAYETYLSIFEDFLGRDQQDQFKLKLGYFNAKKKQRDSDLLFATFQTLYRENKFENFNKDQFQLVIIDEAHHTPAQSYSLVYQHFDQAKYYLGLTATPFRSDNKELFDLFDEKPVPIYFDFKRGIEEGYLTPMRYYILDDDIDYTDIEFNGIKYKKADLDKKLIIEERNEAILREYKARISRRKTLGFCVSQEHAKKMTEFFNDNDIPSKFIIAGTSEEDRGEIIEELKENKIKVIFSIEVFNEGIDIPEVDALMFLRPTDSKLILLQQLGRGLRVAKGKEITIVLDFVGRNQMSSFPYIMGFNKEKIDELEKKLKILKEQYIVDKSEIGEVHFTERSIQTFKRILEKTEGINPEDLIENYYEVKEKIGKEIPTKENMDNESISKYKYVEYIKHFGSWKRFLKILKEIAITADEIYPQGMHLFYIFYIIKMLAEKGKDDTLERPLRPIDFYGSAENINRQTRFRLRALMGMGLIESDLPNLEKEKRENLYQNLTELGKDFYNFILKYKDIFPIDFWKINITKESKHAQYNWKSTKSDNYYYKFIKNEIQQKAQDFYDFLRNFFFNKLIPLKQILRYIFQIKRSPKFSRNDVYMEIYLQGFVREFNSKQKTPLNSVETSRRRYAFPLNLLLVFDVLEKEGNMLKVKKCPLISFLFLKIYEYNDLNVEIDELSDIYNPRIELCRLYYQKFKDHLELFVDVINKHVNKPIYEDLKELLGTTLFTKQHFFNEICNI